MFSAGITSTGNDRYHATTRHSTFEMASDGSASKPVDALLASLCACLGHYVGVFLRDLDIPFADYSVNASSDLTEDHTRLAEIDVEIAIKGAVKWNETLSAALLAFITRCYIYNTLKANSKIQLDVV